jgi:hypothetical protein
MLLAATCYIVNNVYKYRIYKVTIIDGFSYLPLGGGQEFRGGGEWQGM